ncbi:MAG TPA: oligosaccharide flippase family protein [Terriglobales bacterium]|nr:oligosaccharide flippase family protein [Terriglobales bacterium]
MAIGSADDKAESIIPSISNACATPSASVARNSSIAMVGGAISQTFKFLVIIYVARHFSVAEFGLLSFAIAVNAYMFVISNFGLNTFGSRAVAQSGAVPGALLAEICFLQAGLALLGIALAFVILRFVPGISRLELYLVACFGLSNVIQAGLFDWVFQGLHRQEISAALNIFWQGGWLVLTIGGIRLGMGLMTMPAALCISALLVATVGYVWLRGTTPIQNSSQTTPLLRRSLATLRAAAPLGWGTLLMTFIVWGDTATVRFLKGEQAVGWYAAGNRAALAAAMLGTFYVQGTFSYLSQTSVLSQAAFERCFNYAYSDLAMLFIPISFWTVYYAREIILLLFRRADYLAAVGVFRIFQIALLFFVGNTLLGTGVLAACRQDRTFRLVLGGAAAVFLVLCPLLTWHWGIVGSATAVLATQIVFSAWLRHETRKLAPCDYLGPLRWPLATGILIVAACYEFHFALGPGILMLGLGQGCLLFRRNYVLQSTTPFLP